jgi:hypothetical protein
VNLFGYELPMTWVVLYKYDSRHPENAAFTSHKLMLSSENVIKLVC